MRLQSVMPAPAMRMERLQSQELLLRGFLEQLMKKDAEAEVPFPFKRKTVDFGVEDA